jgi:broad specificity polyphosphatase/5'/3'-nucleotidase SurE
MVGAAAEAIKEGIPAIAFSGANSEQRYIDSPYNIGQDLPIAFIF